MTKPALRIVDTNGEIQDGCSQCSDLRDQLAEAESEIRSYRAKLRQAKRDKEADARKHELWSEAVKLFEYWKDRCKHPRSRFTHDRFELLMPFLRDYGPEMCRQAVAGAAFDPYLTQRKNGTMRRHDSLDLIFRSGDKFEDFCNRAER